MSSLKTAVGILKRILEEDMPLIIKAIMQDEELSVDFKAELVSDANTATRMLSILYGKVSGE